MLSYRMHSYLTCSITCIHALDALLVMQSHAPPPPLLAQVREISNMVAPEPFRWTAEALLALQEVRGNGGGR